MRSPQEENDEDKYRDPGHSDEILAEIRREDENKPRVFYQGCKARNAERHEVKPENLPAIQLSRSSRRRSGADEQPGTDNGTQTQGSQPEPWTTVEMVSHVDGIPNCITPQNNPPSSQADQITPRMNHVLCNQA